MPEPHPTPRALLVSFALVAACSEGARWEASREAYCDEVNLMRLETSELERIATDVAETERSLRESTAPDAQADAQATRSCDRHWFDVRAFRAQLRGLHRVMSVAAAGRPEEPIDLEAAGFVTNFGLDHLQEYDPASCRRQRFDTTVAQLREIKGRVDAELARAIARCRAVGWRPPR